MGAIHDWDNSSFKDQVSYFEKNVLPGGNGRDFIFFTNSVMTCDKSFVISTEHMSPDLLVRQ